MLDAALDLLLGTSCVGCDRPGRLLCPACREDLRGEPFLAWPTPTPPGLATPWAAAAYDGTVRAMVLGLKERRLLGLVGPLSDLLVTAVAGGLGADAGSPIVLVPVPSRRATVRARGHDPTRAVTARAARLLHREGLPVTVARPLRLRRRVRDQAGLDAGERAANLAGSMAVVAHEAARLRRRGPHVRTVVCDDVLTTGSTAREAQRALEAAGVPVLAIATVAATARRTPHGDFSADRLLSSPGTD